MSAVNYLYTLAEFARIRLDCFFSIELSNASNIGVPLMDDDDLILCHLLTSRLAIKKLKHCSSF